MAQMTSPEFWGENVVSKNSLKTGMCHKRTRYFINRTPGCKQGRRSKLSRDAKKEKRASAIADSRRKAEENWGERSVFLWKPIDSNCFARNICDNGHSW